MDEMKKDKTITGGGGSEWDKKDHPRGEDGKFLPISEFRYIEKHENPKIKNHPAHLYARSDDEAKFLQITHSAEINGETATVEMHENPNPKDAKKAYFVPTSETRKITDFGKKKKNWNELSGDDDELMRPYRDKPFNKKK